MEKYVEKDLDEIKNMSKAEFRSMVNKSVENDAFLELVQECTEKKKTGDLTYEKLQTQEYLKVLYPNQARIVFKCRSRTLDIKSHSTYNYKDQKCRKCGIQDETVCHIINCEYPEELNLEYTEDWTSNMVQTVRCLKRIEKFSGDTLNLM